MPVAPCAGLAPFGPVLACNSPVPHLYSSQSALGSERWCQTKAIPSQPALASMPSLRGDQSSPTANSVWWSHTCTTPLCVTTCLCASTGMAALLMSQKALHRFAATAWTGTEQQPEPQLLTAHMAHPARSACACSAHGLMQLQPHVAALHRPALRLTARAVHPHLEQGVFRSCDVPEAHGHVVAAGGDDGLRVGREQGLSDGVPASTTLT